MKLPVVPHRLWNELVPQVLERGVGLEDVSDVVELSLGENVNLVLLVVIERKLGEGVRELTQIVQELSEFFRSTEMIKYQVILCQKKKFELLKSSFFLII